MDAVGVLEDGFSRIKELVHGVVEGMSEDELAARIEDGANSIAWLVWHLTRIQDDHVADVAGREQIWVSGGWADKFELPFDLYDTGYGHGPAQVAAVTADARKLRGYYDAVHRETVSYVRGLSPEDLDKVVDTSWDPPVTLSVRLVSVMSDDLQHAGQAAYARGILLRR
ncbi:mycothiol transferase [Actinocorallia sp. A-T 12471]|uniref:mycothiol transferase n=1 Tax=Actinocorallia sp. A-T 12471 TaxID=3089813 RepID=UPI0029D31FD4|nr:DUF664 domain-containing protein [Actinocorallia sp. A-T 12471]MDX6741981.1 DUF664 domain-containing protein [Actinocorallia sp. A-T 12471]